jgi:hypothetical protein
MHIMHIAYSIIVDYYMCGHKRLQISWQVITSFNFYLHPINPAYIDYYIAVNIDIALIL